MAERLARQSVEFVQGRFGISLPGTPQSLILVDAIVDKILATHATQEQASNLLRGLGSYAGQVFVKHARGTWRPAAEMRTQPGAGGFPFVVALPGLVACDVVGEVFRRFAALPGASVAALYETHPTTPRYHRIPAGANPVVFEREQGARGQRRREGGAR